MPQGVMRDSFLDTDGCFWYDGERQGWLFLHRQHTASMPACAGLSPITPALDARQNKGRTMKRTYLAHAAIAALIAVAAVHGKWVATDAHAQAAQKKSHDADRSQKIFHAIGHLAKSLGFLHRVPDGTGFLIVRIEVVHPPQHNLNLTFAGLMLAH